MPEPAESELMAEAWADVLDGEVPISDLERVYTRAMRDKTDTFPLTAPMMVKAYRDICDSDRAAPRIPQEANLLPGEVCKKCFGTGMEEFVVNGYRQAKRCDHVVEQPIGPRDPDAEVDTW